MGSVPSATGTGVEGALGSLATGLSSRATSRALEQPEQALRKSVAPETTHPSNSPDQGERRPDPSRDTDMIIL
jgi:hypothetical protein